MKKQYFQPTSTNVTVKAARPLLQLSSVHNEYKGSDVTYSRRNKDQWDDDDEDI